MILGIALLAVACIDSHRSSNPGMASQDDAELDDSGKILKGTPALPNDARCPVGWSFYGTGAPAACDPAGLICSYPEGQCACSPTDIGTSSAAKWQCVGLNAGCPELAPTQGSACAMPALVCDYIDSYRASFNEHVTLTQACCNGETHAWSAVPDAGCPNGNTCGTIKATDYDQTCTTDADCHAISTGDFCAANSCTNCVSAAINVDALPQYFADHANKVNVERTCPCPSGGRIVCIDGMCGMAPLGTP